jgi:glycosyltransferase involved in cell wall biosynthesis
MRIAFLADASLVHTTRWVQGLAARGHDCLLLSVERGSAPDVVRFEPLPPRAHLPRFLRYTLAVPQAARLVQDFAPDLVNAHFLPNYGWMAARAGFRPLVLTTLGSDILMVPHQSPLHAWRTRWVLSRCDAATSDAAMLTQAIAGFGVPANRILTVPFGIEAARFASVPERPEAPIVVLSTRRLEPLYDVATLVRAFGRLPADRFDLHIAGDGSETLALQRQAAPFAARFLGWVTQTQLDDALRAAHLYVSTSTSDSTSVSLLEAMAAGAFPIVSDIPANREWIASDEQGLLFPCGDDAALAACIQRAGADPALRARAQQRNRAVIAARATWETNLAAVEALFDRLRAQPSGG